MAVPYGIGGSLLYHPVHRLFLVFVKLQRAYLILKGYVHPGGGGHILQHRPQRLLQRKLFQSIRPQLAHGPAHIGNALASYSSNLFQLASGGLWRIIQHGNAGIDSGHDPCQSMAQRVMNLSCQAVALSGFCIALCLHGIVS